MDHDSARGHRRINYDYPRRFLRIAVRRRRLRRRAVLEVAAEHFAQQGFHATNVEAVAAQAFTSKPQLYDLFPSKADLYHAVLHRERRKFEQNVITPLAQGQATEASESDFTSACLTSAQVVFDYQRDRPHSLRVLFGAQNWRMATDLREEARDAWTMATQASIVQRHPRHVTTYGDLSAPATAELLVTCVLGAIEMSYEGRISLLHARDVVAAAAGALSNNSARRPGSSAPQVAAAETSTLTAGRGVTA